MRVLNIKETRKTKRGAYTRGGGAYNRIFLFTGGGTYNPGGGLTSSSLRYGIYSLPLGIDNCTIKEAGILRRSI